MTYTVLSGTLNPSIPYHTVRWSGRCSKMHVSLCTLHVSLNDAFHANCPQVIEKEQWPTSSADMNPLEMSRLRSNAQSFIASLSEDRNSFWIKSCIGKDIGQFSAGLVNKAVSSCQLLAAGWESTWKLVMDILSIHCNCKKCPQLVLALSCN